VPGSVRLGGRDDEGAFEDAAAAERLAATSGANARARTRATDSQSPHARATLAPSFTISTDTGTDTDPTSTIATNACRLLQHIRAPGLPGAGTARLVGQLHFRHPFRPRDSRGVRGGVRPARRCLRRVPRLAALQARRLLRLPGRAGAFRAAHWVFRFCSYKHDGCIAIASLRAT
jgi:hypothetical protein